MSEFTVLIRLQSSREHVTLPPMPTPRAYYNEFDIKAAAWLRELIKAGHIAPGDVDSRSITEVQPADLDGYTQCHFFAGIGGWSYALRLAGWPDERPAWTGSCPCQPFSAAGKRGGTDDARHLWPQFYRLIGERRPATIFGEQVASKDGLAWLDIVSADLERADYAVGAADLCAAGVGAPHIRQRLYFVGQRLDDPASPRRYGPVIGSEGKARDEAWLRVSGTRGGFSEPDGLADSGGARLEIGSTYEQRTKGKPATCDSGGLGNLAESPRQQPHWRGDSWRGRRELADHSDMGDAASDGRQQRGSESGRWSSVGGCEFIPCTDGKARPIEPGSFPLAHGVPHRVGLLRGYGNAIVPQVAAEFIGAYLDIAG